MNKKPCIQVEGKNVPLTSFRKDVKLVDFREFFKNHDVRLLFKFAIPDIIKQ